MSPPPTKIQYTFVRCVNVVSDTAVYCQCFMSMDVSHDAELEVVLAV